MAQEESKQDEETQVSQQKHQQKATSAVTSSSSSSSKMESSSKPQQQPNNGQVVVAKTKPESTVVGSAVEVLKDSTETSSSSKKEKKETIMQAATSQALRPFVIISSSYLLFTVTDGAIRMIVLLHAYNKSFSAMEVAVMFTLYELAGVFTNLLAGFCGAKWGIKFTLITGLSLQLVSYGLLFGWSDDWNKVQAIVYVTIAQMFAGIAKDLTKLGGKTVTKLVTPDEKETKLFKLVSLITGWKNSLKGVGYFLGSALIQVKYELALGVMMGLIVLAMPWAIIGLDRNLGTAKNKNASWRDIFVFDNTNLNFLSLARLFLFASRDFWFEVPLPFYLRSPSCIGLGGDMGNICTIDDHCPAASICNTLEQVCENINVGGGCGGLGVNRVIVGTLLGGYIILYGQVQSWTPQLVTGPLGQTPPNKLTEILWGVINCLPTLVMGIVIMLSPSFDSFDPTQRDQQAMTSWIVFVVVSFAIIFAINSSIHSFLVVNYASRDKVAVSVGFYYMSNALGRLLGTLGSGILYTYVGENTGEFSGPNASLGLAACFFAGTVSSLLAAIITTRINDKNSKKDGLQCGSCCIIVPPTTVDDNDDDEVVDFAAIENGGGGNNSKSVIQQQQQQTVVSSPPVPVSGLTFFSADGFNNMTQYVLAELRNKFPELLSMNVATETTTTTTTVTTTNICSNNMTSTILPQPMAPILPIEEEGGGEQANNNNNNNIAAQSSSTPKAEEEEEIDDQCKSETSERNQVIIQQQQAIDDAVSGTSTFPTPPETPLVEQQSRKMSF